MNLRDFSGSCNPDHPDSDIFLTQSFLFIISMTTLKSNIPWYLILPAFFILHEACCGLQPDQELNKKLEEIYFLIGQDSISIHDRKARKGFLNVIQEACSKLPARVYYRYMKSWEKDSSLADSLELKYYALGYLRKCIVNAIGEIHTTEVKKGMVVWHFYNMGYVFKTNNACFGIDLHCRDAEKLERHLDFLLVTHQHHDHFSKKLLDAMINAGKPVITRGYRGSTIVKKAREFKFGSVRVKIDIGDHHRHLPLLSTNNMLMFQIDCEDDDTCYTIYHSGDGNAMRKMKPDRYVDIYIVHVQLPMPLIKAVNHINPGITFVSHVMELSHSDKFPAPMRWSYDFAYKKMKDIPEEKAIVLTWGERWLLSGTEIIQKDSP